MTGRPQAVVIATPHARHDTLETEVRARLDGVRVVRIRTAEELTAEKLTAIGAEMVFFPHWSWIIPDSVYSGFECVIFHMTDVPYGRGGSPLQNLIVRGHEQTQLSALRAGKEIDAGPVYMKRPLSLDGTAEQILRRAARLTSSMIVDIVEGRPMPVPQQGEPVVFKRRRPEDGNLSAVSDLKGAYDYIRMLDADGYPPAFLDVGPWRLEFREAQVEGDAVRASVHIRMKTDA